MDGLSLTGGTASARGGSLLPAACLPGFRNRIDPAGYNLMLASCELIPHHQMRYGAVEKKPLSVFPSKNRLDSGSVTLFYCMNTVH